MYYVYRFVLVARGLFTSVFYLCTDVIFVCSCEQNLPKSLQFFFICYGSCLLVRPLNVKVTCVIPAGSILYNPLIYVHIFTVCMFFFFFKKVTLVTSVVIPLVTPIVCIDIRRTGTNISNIPQPPRFLHTTQHNTCKKNLVQDISGQIQHQTTCLSPENLFITRQPVYLFIHPTSPSTTGDT